jgi:SAM-dependent methyltransferase
MRTRDEWDKWYARPNPWGTEGGDEDRVRTELLLGRLQHARFANLLDLGCGEGRLTDALSRLSEHTYAIDIAQAAIERARTRFPHIRFEQGDLLDVLRDPEVSRIPFDFISVSEVLYYFQSEEERRAAVAGLARIGAPACLYYFSVIVTGASKYRRYFTHDEFIRMLSEHFQVVDSFSLGVELPRLLSSARMLPHPQLRLALRRMLTTTRKPERCKHVGYFALKRTPAGLAPSRMSPVEDAARDGEPARIVTVGSRES